MMCILSVCYIDTLPRIWGATRVVWALQSWTQSRSVILNLRREVRSEPENGIPILISDFNVITLCPPKKSSWILHQQLTRDNTDSMFWEIAVSKWSLLRSWGSRTHLKVHCTTVPPLTGKATIIIEVEFVSNISPVQPLIGTIGCIWYRLCSNPYSIPCKFDMFKDEVQKVHVVIRVNDWHFTSKFVTPPDAWIKGIRCNLVVENVRFI